MLSKTHKGLIVGAVLVTIIQAMNAGLVLCFFLGIVSGIFVDLIENETI